VAGTCLLRSCSFPELLVLLVLVVLCAVCCVLVLVLVLALVQASDFAVFLSSSAALHWSGLLFVYFDFVRRRDLELDHWKKNAQSQPNLQTNPGN
jgi:hypothetical protein